MRPLKKPVRARYCQGLFTQVPYRDGSVFNVSVYKMSTTSILFNKIENNRNLLSRTTFISIIKLLEQYIIFLFGKDISCILIGY